MGGRDLLRYPKEIPNLTAKQQEAKEQAVREWHENLPRSVAYQWIEEFNHGWVARLPLPTPQGRRPRTLEVGPGLGEHTRWENLHSQEYFVLECRESFCEVLRQSLTSVGICCGDIQARSGFQDGYFDRIIAIHVLEHLADLPAALEEMRRLLSEIGVLDIVIPCEGAFLYSLGRRLTSQRFFERKWKMAYAPIIASEHLSELPELDFHQAGLSGGVAERFG